MKRIRRVAAPVVAALALAGFLSWTGLGIGTPDVARAMGADQAGWTQESAPLSVERIDQAQRQQLTTGCNQVTETGLTNGGKVGDWVTQNVQPASAVLAVWHYDNASQHYKAAFFSDPAVPVDVPTFTQAVDAFFVCVNATATAP